MRTHTKSKNGGTLAVISLIGLVIFVVVIFVTVASGVAKQDTKEKADYGGYTVEDIKSDVEKHLREKDNIPANSTLQWTSISPGGGKASAGILVKVLTPNQDTQNVVVSFKGNADNTYTVTTSLDPDKN